MNYLFTKNYLAMPLDRLVKMYELCKEGEDIDCLTPPITDNDLAFWEDILFEVKFGICSNDSERDSG